jgi:cystathionine beta-synthase
MTQRLSRINYKQNVLETIGHTPLVLLTRVSRGVKPAILGKVEFFNPGGSVKDRIGAAMVDDAVEKGLLKPGGTIVESTSGNTGVGLALVAAVRGYRAIFTMPDKMSQEKIRLLKSYGAEVITCPTAVSPDSEKSYYSVARRIAETTPNAVLANQYFNPLNPETHYKTTGPEIWEDTAGEVDCFVAGIGTGGTISGVARYLKEKKPGVKIIGIDTEGSILRHYFYTKEMTEGHPYLVEGIGEDIVPGTFHPQYIDEMVTVSDRDAFVTARRLAREEGLMVGGSCGAAVFGALEVAKGLDEDNVVVVLLPDTGERYLSKFHSDEWMREHRMMETALVTAGDVVAAKPAAIPAIVTIEAGETIGRALDLMRTHNISQLPVFRAGKSVGRVEEGDLMDLLLSGGAKRDDAVDRVMKEPFPALPADAHYTEALKFMRAHHQAVVIEDRGAAIGILTKHDLVEHVLGGKE